MKHQEFIAKIEAEIPNIKQENLLFWNLWCLNFTFERIQNHQATYYNDFKVGLDILWEMNDTSQLNIDLLNHSSIQAILNFDEEDFDDFDESDKATMEFLEGVESILLNIQENSSIIYNAYEHPMNLIDVIIEGIMITNNNTNPIYLNEANAQLQLVEELINTTPNYSIIHKNIYR